MVVKVSVIVTVYNHDVRYFKMCMESLRVQTLKECEFIIVDNAATPESKLVIEEYEKIDGRFKVIHLEENRGYGRALNIGLKAASGEYLAFVDSDDWAEPDMYEKLYEISKSNPVDIIKGLFYLCEDEKEKRIGLKFSYDKYNKILKPSEAKFYPVSFGSFWSAIYKRSLVVENDIWFDEVPSPSAEDVMFILRTYLCAKSLYFSPLVVFNKRLDNPNSTMKLKDKKAWITFELYLLLEKFIQRKEDIIEKELLGVKARREFLNFYWACKNDITKDKLKFYLAYSNLFRLNLKKRHLDECLFSSKELKMYLNIAWHPIFTFFKEMVYQCKETTTHVKRYFCGIQYYSKRKKKNIVTPVSCDYRNTIFQLIQSVWQTSGVTEELMQNLKFLSQSRYSFKNLREEIMYIYLACLLEKGKIEQAKNLLIRCRQYFKFQNLFRYIYVSKFCLQEGLFDEKVEKAAFVANNFENNFESKVFENYLRGKSIAVVGNSGCELGKGKGKEIDSHDMVVRFGNFPCEYANDYGIKTNVWVRAAGANATDVENRDIDNFDFVVWNQDFKHSVVMYDLLNYLYDSAVRFPQKNIYISGKYRKTFVEKSMIDFPSSGAMFIWYLFELLGSFQNVDFYGFGFLDVKGNNGQHYYDNKCKITTEHHFEEEMIFLKELCSLVK